MMTTSGEPYLDRREAGQVLGLIVRARFHPSDAVVCALSRGGVPVGLEVARAIDAPLDVFLVRTLKVPWQRELAIGAIATGGYELLDPQVIRKSGITPLQVAGVADREMAELRRCEALYRGGRAPLEVEGRVVYLVDDGLATGFTVRAAIGALREYGARQLIVAVPVAGEEICEEIAPEVNAVICPFVPDRFCSVAHHYVHFEPTSDREVCECLAAALKPDVAHAGHFGPG
jgi:predicted phosphoribosyltransferase